MSNLTILNNSIRTLDNLYSLNDLHRASGGENKHQPSLFMVNQQTQDLIAEIHSESLSVSHKSMRTGINRGTWACEELALAYATWISPKFHLVVLRAFIAMHRGELQTSPKNLPVVEPEPTYTFEFTEYELEQLAWLAFSHKQMNDLLEILIQPMDAIGSRYSAMVYSHHHEYKRHYSESLDTVRRLIEPFKQSKRMNWERVVKRLN